MAGVGKLRPKRITFSMPLYSRTQRRSLTRSAQLLEDLTSSGWGSGGDWKADAGAEALRLGVALRKLAPSKDARRQT